MKGLHVLAVSAISAFGFVVALNGCAGSDAPADEPTQQPEIIRISGSGTTAPLMRILTEAYPEGDIDFVYLPGLHSGGGVRGVDSGDLDIGLVSRELNDDESALDVDYIQLSLDGLAVALHPSVGIEALTSEQVVDIYEGHYVSWAELGGPETVIAVLDRSEDESAKIVLRRHLLGESRVTAAAVNLYYEQDMVDGLANTPGAIGYFSLGHALSDNLPVILVELDGVEPTVNAVADGSYSMVRPLGMVVSSDAEPQVTRFIEWTRSAEASGLLRAAGYAPPAGADGEL